MLRQATKGKGNGLNPLKEHTRINEQDTSKTDFLFHSKEDKLSIVLVPDMFNNYCE